MTQRIRFHLDENVDPAVAQGLRRYGIDVTTTIEVQLRGQPDSAQLAYIRETERILFTQDSDFFDYRKHRRLASWHYILSERNAIDWRDHRSADSHL